ncbi:IclR family transcriptional regulator [Aeromicrobium panaciterrae]|uniref:IclR family transcriptional regulator n=1 Tax=Aeromicrobium panaciterrae TaxID=363861 RepID=UPI0031D2E584
MTALPLALDSLPEPDLVRDPLDHRDSVIVRISAIVDAFDPATPVLSLGRLMERTALPKSTVYRLTEQLVELRWLERSASGYRLGLKFFEIGGLVGARSRLRTNAMPHLQTLRDQVGQSVHMGVLDNLDVVILAKIWGLESTMPTWDGGRMPAYCTATGKVLLAHSSTAVVEAAIARGLPRRTQATVVHPLVFRNGLEKIRNDGFAVEYEENVAGLCCVAAPILDHAGNVVAAVSVSGSLYSFDLVRATPFVVRCAAAISGHPSPKRR